MSDDAISEFEDRRKQSLWERLDAIEQENRRGHKDLRKTVQELESQVDSIDHDVKSLTAVVANAALAPVEATKIRFSTGVMVSIVAVTISIAGGAYGIISRIDALAADVMRQSTDDKKERASLALLYDERNTRTLGAIDALTRQQKLLEYELQRLREDVTKKGSTR